MARPYTLYGNHVSNQSSSRTTSRKPRFFWLRLFQKKKGKKLEICKRLKYKVILPLERGTGENGTQTRRWRELIRQLPMILGGATKNLEKRRELE